MWHVYIISLVLDKAKYAFQFLKKFNPESEELTYEYILKNEIVL